MVIDFIGISDHDPVDRLHPDPTLWKLIKENYETCLVFLNRTEKEKHSAITTKPNSEEGRQSEAIKTAKEAGWTLEEGNNGGKVWN